MYRKSHSVYLQVLCTALLVITLSLTCPTGHRTRAHDVNTELPKKISLVKSNKDILVLIDNISHKI